MIYTVTMNPAVDYLVYLDSLSCGRIQRSTSEAFYFSGKGINVSKVLKTLGMPALALGFLSGFTGRAIADAMREEEIPADFCMLPPSCGNTRINVKLRHGAETDVNCTGPVIPADALEDLALRLDRAEKGDVVILSGSVPASLPKTVYEELLGRLSGKGLITVVDADGELFTSTLVHRPFLVKPNDEELVRVTGMPCGTDDEVLLAAENLQKRGARNVLVSLGGRGAILLTEGGEAYRMGVAAGELCNSIGAGDSMLAGFLAGYLQSGGDYAFALRLGTATGGATAFSEGLCTRGKVDALLQDLPQPTKIR